MSRFISLYIFLMGTIVAMAENFSDSIPASDGIVTISSRDLGYEPLAPLGRSTFQVVLRLF